MFLQILGYLMLLVFIVLVLWKKLSPMSALIIIPIVFGLIGGFGTDTFTFAENGIKDVINVFTLLGFAILFFGIMIKTGLFDPLSKLIVRWAKGDPLKVLIGAAVLVTLVSLDGDGTTTFMICCSALIPVFNRLGIPRRYLAAILVLGNGAINLVPWGGPTARIMSVLNTDVNDLFVALIPNIVVSLVLLFAIAIYWGLQQRKNIGVSNETVEVANTAFTNEDEALRRPKLAWVNLVLTLGVMASIAALDVSAPIAFALGSCIALVINYPRVKDSAKVVEMNAAPVMNVVFMVIGAGMMMGILNYSGMADAIGQGLASVVPQSMSSYFGMLIGGISAPGLFVLNNDAFYYGVLPLLAKTAYTFGFTPMQVGVASLMGQSARAMSPVIPSLYLMINILNLDFTEYQKTILPVAVINFVLFALTCLVFGTVPILH
jgi:CitMHS family citrate-Mg2+:H+ or citrate-Ca2+:H+ symporter